MLITSRCFLAGLLLAVVPMSAGCSAGITASQSADFFTNTPGTVVIGTTAAPASLDFTTTGGAAIPQALMGNVYEGLVEITQDGEIQPLLAKHWTVSDDGRSYVFELRDDVTFSNGDTFNAHTAKFSLDRVRSESWTNGLKKQMDVVESVEVLNDYTLKVVLTQRSNSWLWAMGTLVGAMMSPNGVADLAQQPIGTGPYVVENWAIGTSLSFQAREDYWGEQPLNQRALFRYFADAIALTNAVRSGNIDVALGVQSPELLDNLRADRTLDVHVGTTNGEVLLSMNHRRKIFQDIRVRQAILYGIDRQAILDTTWEGYGVDTGGTPVPPTDPWYEGRSQYTYDLAKARQLLAESGYAGSEIVLSVPSLPYAQAAAEILYSQLRDIGFSVRIESTEFPAVWLAKVYKGHDYDLSLIAHVEARDIPNIFGNAEYYLGVDNPEISQQLKEADAAAPTEYAAKMKQAVHAIMDYAAADTLYNLPSIVVTRTGISGVPVNSVADGFHLDTIAKKER